MAHGPFLHLPESGVLLSLMVAGKEFCCQLVPTWIIQLLSQLQAFNFITSRVDSDCFGFIPGLRSFLPEAAPAPGSCPPQRQRIWDSGSFCAHLGAPLSLPQPCGAGTVGTAIIPILQMCKQRGPDSRINLPKAIQLARAGLNLDDGWTLN